MIMGDEGHINRLFTNLVLNSVQANTDQTKRTQIRIACYLQGDRVLVSLSDDSGGISSEFTDLLFTPNFTTKTAGTGLGLAICKKIMEQAGGTIRFESQWGRGTTFFMEWPQLVR
jgi:signal transduction histidine kinase